MVIIEGLDGVGKTTLVDYFVSIGMKKHHFDYDVKNMDLFIKYLNVLCEETNNIVLDRSFISEMVYGPVLRNYSKLSFEQFIFLLKEYNQNNTSLIYLTAPKEILLSRRINDIADYELIKKHYDSLNSKYDEIMDISKRYINILQLNSHILSKEDLQHNAKRLVLK